MRSNIQGAMYKAPTYKRGKIRGEESKKIGERNEKKGKKAHKWQMRQKKV